MNGTRPLCECGMQAMARIQNEVIEPETFGDSKPKFLCSECTIRMTRVADVQGKLLDVRVFDPSHVSVKSEAPNDGAIIEGAGETVASTEGFKKVEIGEDENGK